MEEFELCLSETPECIEETTRTGGPRCKAAYGGETEMLKMLIEKGAELDAPCDGGRRCVRGCAGNSTASTRWRRRVALLRLRTRTARLR